MVNEAVKVGFHRAAIAELRAAARYYEDRVPGLGAEFVAEVERVCAAAGAQRAHPEAQPLPA